MVQASTLIKDVTGRDIFFLRPAGFTPSSEIAQTNRDKPTQKDVPINSEGDMLPGEALIVSNSSEVVIGGGEGVPLSSFRSDRGLMEHVLGSRHHRLPFSLRYYNSGIWSTTMQELKEKFFGLAVDAKDDAALARVISRNQMEVASKSNSYSMLFRDVVETRRKLRYFIGQHPMRLMDPLVVKYAQMKTLISSLRRTPPPVRFNYTAMKDQRADSMLVVTSTEMGAELLLGWKGEMRCERGRQLRQQIGEGVRSAYDYITPVEAFRGYAHHIPAMFPFGMTGGIKAYLIEPNVRSYMLDDWSRTPNNTLWKKLCDDYTEWEIERLFTERVIPWNLMRARRPGNSERKRHVVEMCNPYRFGNQPWHPFESEHFSVSVMPIQYKRSGEFTLVSQVMPTAWVIVYGAVSVRSPRGHELDLSQGDACLFPASACGNYAISVMQEPTCLLAVSSTPMPFNALGLEFMRGYAAG